MYIERNTETRSQNIVAVEKQYVLHICLCVRARIRAYQRECVILWRHLWHPWLSPFFRHYLINGAILEKNIIENKMCALICSTTFV